MEYLINILLHVNKSKCQTERFCRLEKLQRNRAACVMALTEKKRRYSIAGNGQWLAEGRLKLMNVCSGGATKELDFLSAAARGHQAFGKPVLCAVYILLFALRLK